MLQQFALDLECDSSTVTQLLLPEIISAKTKSTHCHKEDQECPCLLCNGHLVLLIYSRVQLLWICDHLMHLVSASKHGGMPQNTSLNQL
jgi:hypothetical protein